MLFWMMFSRRRLVEWCIGVVILMLLIAWYIRIIELRLPIMMTIRIVVLWLHIVSTVWIIILRLMVTFPMWVVVLELDMIRVIIIKTRSMIVRVFLIPLRIMRGLVMNNNVTWSSTMVLLLPAAISVVWPMDCSE